MAQKQKWSKKVKANAAEEITLHPIERAQTRNLPVGITGDNALQFSNN